MKMTFKLAVFKLFEPNPKRLPSESMNMKINTFFSVPIPAGEQVFIGSTLFDIDFRVFDILEDRIIYRVEPVHFDTMERYRTALAQLQENGWEIESGYGGEHEKHEKAVKKRGSRSPQ